ncbi:MAG: urease accessory protein UreD [Rikenellaceae bacterium]
MESEIKLRVATKEGGSYIRSLYTSPPFRVVSVGQLARDNAAYLMIMSTSPGVLSGDRYTMTFTVEDGASLQLKSQSYQRVFDMDGEAHQNVEITIGDGARFSQVAHPIVPHRNSSFFTTTKVEMGARSSFLQGEIITCGRRLHGEVFEFRNFMGSVTVRQGEVLRLKDRVWLSPTNMPLMQLGLLEGSTHQGTLIYQTTCEEEDIELCIEALYEMLSSDHNIKFGISRSHHPGFIIRALGEGGEALLSTFQRVQEYMWNRGKERG